MKKLKQIALFAVIMAIFIGVSPTHLSFAVANDSNSNMALELGNEVNVENKESVKDIESLKKGENLNADNNSISDSLKVESKFIASTLLDGGNQSTIISKLENPVMDHKLTDSFQVRGYAISKDGISNVEIYLDGNKIANATYGIERKDIGSKYADYPNSNNSGFKYNFTNVSNGNHEVKISVVDSKGNKSDSVINVNISNVKTPVMGNGSLDRGQMINLLRKFNSSLDLRYISDFVDITIKEAKIEGLNHDILFAQMMHETGYLNFGGDVKLEQNNFAGIGATGNGNQGNSFPTIEIGIRAVAQHLKAYASTGALKQELVDPRFNYVKRGSALYLEYLGIPENPEGYGWAAARSYGYNILSLINEIYKLPKVTNFSILDDVVISGRLATGSKITMDAIAKPENDTLYRIWVCNRDDDKWTLLSDYSTKKTVDFYPNKAGNYSFVVHVKHKSSNTQFQDHYINKDFKVAIGTSNITSINVSGSKFVNETLTMTAGADPSADTLYKLWVCDRSTDTWTVLSDYSIKNTATFVPKKSGIYSLVAHVKHRESNTLTQDDYKSMDINVTAPKSTATSLNVTGNKIVNETLTMTAGADPSADTLYKLWVCDRSTDTWTVLSDYSTKNTVTFMPKKSGNYTFVAHVKHKNSVTKTQDDYKSMDINVTAPKSTATSLSVTGNKIVNEILTMTAGADPSADTLYKLWVCDRSTDTWTVLSDYSTKNTVTFVPKKSGNYTFVAHMKHKNSATKTQDDYKSMDINVTAPKSTATSLNVTGNKLVNEILTMTAGADPSADTLYKLWVCDRSTDTWTVLSDYSTKNTVTFVPKKSGNYTFVVHVKHKNSGYKTQDDYKSIDISVAEMKSEVKSLDITGEKYTGYKMTMTATAYPTADTLYRLWVCERNTDTWTLLSDYSSKNVAEFTPVKEGKYSFVVHLKHKNSSTVTQDSYKSMDFNITNKKSTVKNLELKGNNIIGQAITMTATAEPSTDTLYKLWVCDRSTDTWTVLSDYSSNNTATFTPTKKGYYSFVVHVKNKYNNSSVQDDYMSKDIFVGEKDKATAISLDVKGNLKVNNQILIEALAEPRSEALYKIWIADRKTETWTLLSDYSTNRTISFTPTSSGLYSVVVHVKHKNSKNDRDEYIAKDISVRPSTALIVIDPGHNYGGDYGAVRTHNGTTYSETVLNMQVASKLKTELVSRGYEVVLTREENDRENLSERESLMKRVKIANDINADLFVSIHQNSNENSSAKGVEVYYSSETSSSLSTATNKITESKKLAVNMVNNISSQLGYQYRGDKDEAFYVIKNTNMPSVLVECGFISNPDEAKKLADPNNQLKLAKILADQIQKQF